MADRETMKLLDRLARGEKPNELNRRLKTGTESVDRVESAVLLSLIGGGLAFCVLGSAIYDIGRVFSVW